jgi:hypothetical protein
MCLLADDDKFFADSGITKSEFYRFTRSLSTVEFEQFMEQICERYEELGGELELEQKLEIAEAI